MKTFKAFKQGKLFELKQQDDRIITTIYDPQASTIEECLTGKTLVLFPGSIVLWDKLVSELEAAE